MEIHNQVSLFISYSHTDSSWMEIFRKELQAALFGRAKVWCDQGIGEGAQWQSQLTQELRRCDVALVLVTSDYLISPWCRGELRFIEQKAREKQIKKVIWVQLKPCIWERTPLAAFQSKGSVYHKALSEIEDPIARQREIIDIVREISSAVEDIAGQLDPSLTFVHTLIGDQALEKGLSIESVIDEGGDFAIVCRGRTSNQSDVAIKVLKRSPIKEILQKLGKFASQRNGLNVPGFIQLYDSFLADSQYGEHLVLVMEYCNAERLSNRVGKFDLDDSVSLIRRAADTLKHLHTDGQDKKRAITDIDESCYGLMMPTHLYYDDRLNRIRFSSLSITNFMWDVLGWRKFAAWVDPESARYVAPEQITATESIDKRKLDQYMLGQLAIELLDGRLPFVSDGVDNIDEVKKEFFQEPLKNAGQWKDYHRQLARIISKMLHRNPDERWESMKDVVDQLRGVEDEARALARYSYLKWLDNEDFFKEFYDEFFKQAENAKSKFTTPDEQHKKLRDSVITILNFYPGNEPTSISRKLAQGHKKKEVTPEEYEKFKLSFLAVLKLRLGNHVEPKLAEKALKGWEGLFGSVIEYFNKEGIEE